jgi:YVTN family beta-propeller protein
MRAFFRNASALAIALIGAALALPGSAVAAGNAFIPNFGDGTLSVVDTTTNTVTATIGGLGTGPEGVAFTPDGTKLLVTARAGVGTGSSNGALEIIDTATNTVTAEVPVAVNPVGIVVSPDSRTAYFVSDVFTGPPNLMARPSDNPPTNLDLFDIATQTVTTMIAIDPSSGAVPFDLAISPDGSTLFIVTANGTEQGTLQIVDPAAGTVLKSIPLGNGPAGIAVTPNGSQVYVANQVDNTVSVVSTAAGAVTATLAVGQSPFGVAVTPDGAQIWVANEVDDTVSVIDTTTNQVTGTFPAGAGANAVGFSPDGTKAYVTDGGSNVVGPAAGNTVSVLDSASGALIGTITVGSLPMPVGSFTAPVAAPASVLLSSILPGSRSVEIGSPATVFATVLNTSATTLGNCAISLPASAPAGLSLTYQMTDPATNAPVGAPNMPVTIQANGAQSFLLTFKATAAIDAPGLPLVYGCDGASPAPSTIGLNTIDLQFSSTPIADVIALEATVTPGVVEVPFSTGGLGAFAIATDNVGAAGALTVSADTGAAALPVTLSICQTMPATGACLAAPAASVQVDFASGATPTFSLFVGAAGAIAFNPGGSRIFVRFEDASGATHGLTSVAVETD